MLKYNQLSSKEQIQIKEKADHFLKTHKKRIQKSINKDTYKTAPSGSDLFKPELWKESHWNWYLN